MGYNPTTRTFDTISDLKKQVGAAGVQVKVLGYYAIDDNGGGNFYWDSSSTELDNLGTIIQVTNAGLNGITVINQGRWKRIYTSDRINLLWFGAKGDGVFDNSTAWINAKAALPSEGGEIHIPNGIFSNSTGWHILRNYLKITGAGANATTLMTPINSNVTGMQFGNVRGISWITSPNSLITYEDTVTIGQDWVDIKSNNDFSILTVGTPFFLNAGGSYFDQHFGEFNVVTAIEGNRIYCRYHWSRDFTSIRSSYAGTLTADFTPPAEGATAIAQVSLSPGTTNNIAISLGNNLYQVTALNGPNSITLKNLGKGNGTDVLPAGTFIYKSRAIFPTPGVALDTRIEGVTISGSRKSLVVDNSIGSVITDCIIVWNDGSAHDGGGTWLEGDNGRDFSMINCVGKVVGRTPINSQMARSFIDGYFERNIFYNVTLEFSEFNQNFTVKRNRFYYSFSGGGSTFTSPVQVGTTTNNINIEDNDIYASECYAAIRSTDVQGYGGISGTSIRVINNRLFLSNVQRGIDVFRSGSITIDGNKIFGSCVYVFGASGSTGYSSTNQYDSQNRFQFINECRITNNVFAGNCDGVINRGGNNLYFENNTFNRLDHFTQGGNGSVLANGNILPNYSGTIDRIVFRNNEFRNWYYTSNSITQTIINQRCDISNNKFFETDSTSTGRKDKDFVITIQDEKRSFYGSINYFSQIKNKEIDWASYLEFIKLTNGVLSTTEITATRQLLDDLYNNNLRDKIKYLYPFVGDINAAKVPLIGWDKTIYKSLVNNNLTYNPTSGWIGDALNSGILFQSTELDITNVGLFVQITSPPTANTAYQYIGKFNGNSTAVRIVQSSNGLLVGVGGASIITSGYNPSNGFIYSGLSNGVQLNYIDSTNHKVNNTTVGTAQIVGSLTNFYLLGNGTVGSNGSIGMTGVTDLFTLSEAQTMRMIAYNYMVSLGRPVQTTSTTPIITSNYDYASKIIPNFTSITVSGITKIYLNTNYPTARIKDRVQFTNITDYSPGIIIAEKYTSTDWFFIQTNSFAT